MVYAWIALVMAATPAASDEAYGMRVAGSAGHSPGSGQLELYEGKARRGGAQDAEEKGGRSREAEEDRAAGRTDDALARRAGELRLDHGRDLAEDAWRRKGRRELTPKPCRARRRKEDGPSP